MFAGISVSLAGLGQPEAALEAIGEIRNFGSKGKMMADAARALAQNKAIGEGLRIAERIADPTISARALLSIAAAYAESGNTEEAHRAAAAAWKATGKVTDPDEYSALLIPVAAMFARVKAYPEAILALEGCERAADRLEASCGILYWDSFHRNQRLAPYIRSVVQGRASWGGESGLS
jgi:hypothetical protein